MTKDALRRAVDAGSLVRLRRGWYASPALDHRIADAARVGGRLTCLAALRLHGAWVERADLHVRIADGTAIRRGAASRIHRVAPPLDPGLDTAIEAIECAVHCTDLRSLVATIDSVLHRRIAGPSEVCAALSTSARGRRIISLLDPAAESGIETFTRLALRAAQVRFRTQVRIEAVGRVDFLVGDRLVVECDGYEWHGDRVAFERDRARDRELVKRGYVVVRASYRQVVDDLAGVMDAVLGIVRRREHRWREVHRAELSRFRGADVEAFTDPDDFES